MTDIKSWLQAKNVKYNIQEEQFQKSGSSKRMWLCVKWSIHMLKLLVLKCIFTIYKIIFKMIRITALYFHLLSTLYHIQHTLLYCLITTFVAFRLYTYQICEYFKYIYYACGYKTKLELNGLRLCYHCGPGGAFTTTTGWKKKKDKNSISEVSTEGHWYWALFKFTILGSYNTGPWWAALNNFAAEGSQGGRESNLSHLHEALCSVQRLIDGLWVSRIN